MTGTGRQWLIDAGNSRIKCALVDAGGTRGEVLAIDHRNPAWLTVLLQTVGQPPDSGTAWLASVAPAARAGEIEAGLRGAGLQVMRVASQASVGHLRIAYTQPSQLGVDRFLGLLAASERNDGPWLVVSAGSALTIDLLAADGQHHGGLIAPMPDDMRGALARRFPPLDVEPGRAMDFAGDTADAIASGAHGAITGLVERSLRQAREKLGVEVNLLVSGGAALLLDDVPAPRRTQAPWLVLDGLAAYVRQGQR